MRRGGVPALKTEVIIRPKKTPHPSDARFWNNKGQPEALSDAGMKKAAEGAAFGYPFPVHIHAVCKARYTNSCIARSKRSRDGRNSSSGRYASGVLVRCIVSCSVCRCVLMYSNPVINS